MASKNKQERHPWLKATFILSFFCNVIGILLWGSLSILILSHQPIDFNNLLFDLGLVIVVFTFVSALLLWQSIRIWQITESLHYWNELSAKDKALGDLVVLSATPLLLLLLKFFPQLKMHTPWSKHHH